MDYAQARAAPCSSCEIKEDMSNDWTPQLFIPAQNGSFILGPVVGDGDGSHGGMTAYYLQSRRDMNIYVDHILLDQCNISQRRESDEKFNAFLEGFRVLDGDPIKRNFTGGLDSQAVNFICLGANQPETSGFPKCNCRGGLRAQILFPACWNGKDLDVTNHKIHMSYPTGQNYNNGPCPAGFPVHMTSIFFEVLYETNRFAGKRHGSSQPFVLANGDPSGYGMHGDFVNGWDINVLQKAVENCLGSITIFTGAECQACRLPTVVDEHVQGWMPTLPDCNPITNGPGPALKVAGNGVYTGYGTDSYFSRTFSKSEAADDMAVEKCVGFCISNSFSYAGLEYSRECSCDNTLSDAAAPALGVMGVRTMKCSGDTKKYCGGTSAISICQRCSDTSCKNAQFGTSGNRTTPTSTAVAAVVSSSPKSPASIHIVSPRPLFLRHANDNEVRNVRVICKVRLLDHTHIYLHQIYLDHHPQTHLRHSNNRSIMHFLHSLNLPPRPEPQSARTSTALTKSTTTPSRPSRRPSAKLTPQPQTPRATPSPHS
ncbi:hypothetical protein K432DRAFT_401237 [Lepidopterella palustris CBS 459.81]|uniref:WSC domain-containing protein n=1 Tax=Lepidopterella palustris CBS 459.81 TaxID=1314670 RepID=A0A8E2EID2_9PEZI|nr:hypothetical protein K432DRAFT_401237 [Lepidopterella palustris CBS 459.81]